ncbi:MAG: tetratricopeptide repeat protein [Phycisphaeraceae bacterium]|nr:tetratricopeptide repeat protein [Phycisphaeraceae bacterium]
MTPGTPSTPRIRRTARSRVPGGVLACAATLLAVAPGGCGMMRGETPTTGPSRVQSSSERPTVTAGDLVAAGRVLRTRGDVERALRAFERAIEMNPQYTAAYLAAGDIYREQGDYSSAERSYGQAAQIEPRNFDAQYSHGLALQLLSRFGEAVRAYLRALAIRPDDFQANLNIATAYLQLGDAEQGLPYAQRAVRLSPSSGEARVNLASIYAGLGRHTEAVTELQQASEMMSLNGSLLLNLANSLYQLGRFAEAANTLEEAVRLEPGAIAYERLGASRYRLGQATEAEAAFRRSLEADPAHYPAMNGVAVCLLSRYVLSDQTDEAARLEAMGMLRNSLRIEPQQPRVIELVRQFGA